MTKDITKLPFNFDTTLYEPENAYWMAIFANLAYIKVGDKTGKKKGVAPDTDKKDVAPDTDKKDVAPDTDVIKEKLKAMDDKFLEVEGFNCKSSQEPIPLIIC